MNNLQPGNATTSEIQQHRIPGSSAGTTEYHPTGTRDRYGITDADNYPYQR